MDVQETIANAIQQRRKLAFRYQGLERVVDPYALGYLGTGNLVLTAYQTGGQSRSKYGIGWRDFVLKKIRAIRLLDDKISSKPAPFNRITAKYRTVLNQL